MRGFLKRWINQSTPSRMLPEFPLLFRKHVIPNRSKVSDIEIDPLIKSGGQSLCFSNIKLYSIISSLSV